VLANLKAFASSFVLFKLQGAHPHMPAAKGNLNSHGF